MLSGAAYYGMVRQNASLENMVQVRAARLKEVGGRRRRRQVRARQRLPAAGLGQRQLRQEPAGCAGQADIDARHAAIRTRLGELARVTARAESKPVDASLAALAAYRKAVQETIEMAQVDQSIATNSMQKAEKEFGILNQQLARLAALEKTLSEQAYAAARAEFHAWARHGACWCCCRSRCRWR
jgi:hypothetical protein